MDIVEPMWFVLGLGVPATLGLCALLLAFQPGRSLATPGGMAMGWAMGIAVGGVAAVAAVFGRPQFLPGPWTAWRWQDWLVVVLVAAGAIEMLAGLSRALRWLALLPWAALLVVGPYVVMLPVIRAEETARASQTANAQETPVEADPAVATAPPPASGEPSWTLSLDSEAWYLPVFDDFAASDPRRWLPVVIGALAVLFVVVRTAAWVRPGRDLPITLGLAAVGAGITIASSGSLTIGQLAIGLGAAIAGGCLVVLWIGRPLTSPGIELGAFVYSLLLAIGYFYTYDPFNGREGLTRVSVALLTAGPLLGCLITLLLPARLDKPWLRVPLRVILTLLPVAIAAGMAYRAFLAAEAEAAGGLTY